jgi:hypothetical protein
VSLKERCQNYFIGKNKRSCAVRTCNYAVRFTDYFVGTQFHPEADPVSLFPILEIRRPKKKIKSMKGEKNSKLCLKTWMMTRSQTNETLIQIFFVQP